MNDIEGKIRIDLYPRPMDGCHVEIRSTRPVSASRVMVGKRPQQALELIPLMFNICGNAQARTAVAAINSSLGHPQNHQRETARDMMVLVENAREHMFRVFIDWPKLFNLEADSNSVHPLGSMITNLRQALFGNGKPFMLDTELQPDIKAANSVIEGIEHHLRDHVFQMNCSEWLQLDSLDTLNNWLEACDSVAALGTRAILQHGWSAQGSSRCPNLPDFDIDELTAILDSADSDQFIATPMWREQHHESTPLSRQLNHPLVANLVAEYDHALLPRWIARLVELALIPGQLRSLLEQLHHDTSLDQPIAAAHGIAFSEAARGRLVHRVQIKDDLITNYQIVAPTEWNFHPQGLIHQSLSRLSHDDPVQLDQLARLMINSIDPCVGYDLTIHPEGSAHA